MNITALILAAGQSKRFGNTNKLLTPYEGVPLIDHCLNLVFSNDFNDRILVTGFENKRIETRVQNLPIRSVYNADYENGMGSSLAAGVRALDPSCDAFMIFLADMPDIPDAAISKIVLAYKDNQRRISIVRPTYDTLPGHPVLFAARHKSELEILSNDQGAFNVIQNHRKSMLNLEVGSQAVLRDIDQLSDLQE